MDKLKIDFKELTLENGFKIIVLKRESKFFNLNFGIKVGSAYEDENEKGYSHFIEHMLFRSNFKYSDYEVSKIIEFLGGDYNAYTEYGSTTLSVNGFKDDLEKALELIHSMVTSPKFDENEIDIERDIILSEFDSCMSNYEDYSYMRVNEEAFETSHLKYDIAGTKEVINKITGEKLREFYLRYYVPNNSYMVVISSYDESYVIDLIKKYFNSWQIKTLEHKKLIDESNICKTIVTEKSDLEVSTITYLYNFDNLQEHEKILLKIAEYRLGGSSNSILFKRIREEEGLAYDVYADVEFTDEFKGMYIFCVVNDKNIDKAIYIINDCIENIKKCKNYFDEYNLRLMKKLQLMYIYGTLEDNERLGLYLIDKMIYKKEINYYLKDLTKIENTNAEELMDICKKYFKDPTVHILKRK